MCNLHINFTQNSQCLDQDLNVGSHVYKAGVPCNFWFEILDYSGAVMTCQNDTLLFTYRDCNNNRNL
jgi:hypothetical protein